jgi:glycosyltransferase domain-containing protein
MGTTTPASEMALATVATPTSDDRRNILAAHTLVIPTYNRPALLKRLILHYAARAPEMAVLVLDSSKPEVAAANAATIKANHPHAQYRVFTSDVPMATKLSRGLAEVATPTVSFCADDDLVFLDGLAEAITFIKDHPDYVSAHGLYLNFTEAGQTVIVAKEYAGESNEAAHPGARVFRLFQNYESLFYGAFRSADLREIFEGVAGLPTLHYQELFQSVAALIKGKVKRFPKFYAARRSGPEAEPGRDKWQTYYWFADNPTEFVQHSAAYRETLWDFYSRHSTPALSRDDFFRTLDIAHSVYFSKACPPRYFHSILQPLWPGDKFVERFEDLFKVLQHPNQRRSLSKAERLLMRVLRLTRRWRLANVRPTAASAPALTAFNETLARQFQAPWRCALPPGLMWLAANDEFRVNFRELILYLDGAPAG